LGFAVAFVVFLLPLTVADYVEKYTWLIIINTCLAALIDITNTMAMCYWLIKAQKEINIKR